MMVIRPVVAEDLAGLMTLAGETGGGLTSLPADEKTLAARIERSQQTWRGELPKSEQGYVFVLEETSSGAVVGICAIEVAVGLNDPWYNYRVGTQVHASKELNVYSCARCFSTRPGVKRATAICCRNRASCLWPRFASTLMKKSWRRCAA